MLSDNKLAVAPCFREIPVYQTAGISEWCAKDKKAEAELTKALQKFLMLDWGDTCPEDVELNNSSLAVYDEIVACYNTSGGDIFIIADGKSDGLAYSHITILFPGEY